MLGNVECSIKTREERKLRHKKETNKNTNSSYKK
jgi:hypothetical protein